MFNSISANQSQSNIGSGLSTFSSEKYLSNQANKFAKDQFNNIKSGVMTQLNSAIDSNAVEMGALGLHLGYRGYKAVKAYNAAKSNPTSAAVKPKLEINTDDKNFPDNVGFEAAPPKTSSARFVTTVTKGIQTRGPGGYGKGGSGLGDFDTSRYRYDPKAGRAVSRETGKVVTDADLRQGLSERKEAPEPIDPEGDLPFNLTQSTKDLLDSISQTGSVADKVNLFSQRQPVYQPKAQPKLSAVLAPEVPEPIKEDEFNLTLPEPTGTYRRGGTSIGSSAYNIKTQVRKAAAPIATQTQAEPIATQTQEPEPVVASVPVATKQASSASSSGVASSAGPTPGELTVPKPSLARNTSDLQPGPKIDGEEIDSTIADKALGAFGVSTGVASIAASSGSLSQKLEEGGELGGIAAASKLFGGVSGGVAAGGISTAETILGSGTLKQKAISIGENIGTLGITEAAEAALPGLGEVLMAATAVGGLVSDLLEKHKESEETAPPPSAPVAPSITFNSSPVLDSSSYRGYLGGLQN